MYVREGFGFPCGNAPLIQIACDYVPRGRCADFTPKVRARLQRTSGREMHRYLRINLGRNSNNTVEAVTQKAMSVYPDFVNNWHSDPGARNRKRFESKE